MIRSGFLVYGLRYLNYYERGNAPSLDIANAILEVTVIVLNPEKNATVNTINTIINTKLSFELQTILKKLTVASLYPFKI
jgi:hypothetical protein